jgi:hypothetical protein
MSISTIAQATNQGISNARGDIDNFANTILKPKDAEGIGGFMFDIPEAESLTLSSDITDHYTENNSYLNDHIVRKPIIITLSGYVGELLYEGPQGFELLAQELTNRLETVEAFAGDFTPGVVQKAQAVVSQVQNTISAINQQLDKVQNIVSILSKNGQEETKQQKAYNTLRTLWEKQEPFSVVTPWDYLDSMVIQSISVSQNEETEQITDISVSLKQIRQAKTKYSNYDTAQFAPREEIQSGNDQSQGKIQGESEELTSFLAGGSGGLGQLFGG